MQRQSKNVSVITIDLTPTLDASTTQKDLQTTCVRRLDLKLDSQHRLDAIVGNNDHGTTNTTGQLWDHALIHALQALFLEYLLRAIERRLVDTILGCLFRL